MPRYTFVDGSSSKFWQIDRDGSSFTVVYGRIGTDGQSQTKSFDDNAAAEKEYDKLIREKTKKGYVLQGESAAPSAKPVVAARSGGNPEAERRIAEDPNSAHDYAVYADWLTEQGDPLGAFILSSLSGTADAKKSAAKLLKQNAKAWTGIAVEDPNLLDLEWKYGVIHAARVTMEYDGEPHAKAVLKSLLSLPTARFLQKLVLGLYYDERETYEINYGGAVKLLAAHGSLPTLRELFIGDFEYPDETEISWAKLGKVDAIWGLFPNVESVRLRGGEQKLGTIVAPKLKKFVLETGGLDVGALKSITAADWPEIEDIEVWFGSDEYGWNGKPKDVLPLLQRTDLTKLRRLALKNNELHEVIAGHVLNAAVLPQLSALDLSMSTLDDAVGEQFIANAQKLSHLKVLDLSDCYLSKAMTKRLKAALPQVDISGQREPDDWGDALHRYSSVGE